MKKEYIELSLLFILCLAVLGFAFWQGMNRELCSRGYSNDAYAQMELNCKKD